MKPSALRLLHDLSDGAVSVIRQDRVIWTYRYTGAPKPYVHPFATPSGGVLSLASPHDHIHHRGLMLAWRVNGVNFWEESPTKPGEVMGDIRHESWETMALENGGVVLAEKLAWIERESGRRHLVETRELRVVVDETLNAVRCLWKSTFTSPDGDAVISGYTVHCPISYYGLGFRFARAMDHGGRHLDSENRDSAADANGKNARWHLYSSHLDECGTPVGVLIGDSPENPGHPTPWFQVSQPPAPFAYVTASLIAHEEVKLAAGKELNLSYAIWGHEGAWSSEQCESAWNNVFKK